MPLEIGSAVSVASMKWLAMDEKQALALLGAAFVYFAILISGFALRAMIRNRKLKVRSARHRVVHSSMPFAESEKPVDSFCVLADST